MSARDDILARIHAALGTGTQSGPAPAGADGAGSGAEAAGIGASATLASVRAPAPAYRTTSGLTGDGLVDLLVDRLEDYKARVEVVAKDKLAEAIRSRLQDKTFVAPHGLPAEWLHPDLAAGVVRDVPQAPLGVERLDAMAAVLTSSAVSIAETGTIVLDGSPDQGRRAISLLPDHHVCVVPLETIVGIVPEGFARLDITRPLTLISGPSATSDIELERVEGVHGPRTLDVIIAV